MRNEFIDTLIISDVGRTIRPSVEHRVMRREQHQPNIAHLAIFQKDVMGTGLPNVGGRNDGTVFGSNFPTGRFNCPISHSHMPTLTHSQRAMRL